MASAFSKGRPIEPLVETAEERAHLERQVRRRRVSRSLSERCRIILRCADGLQSKVVAAEPGVHEHTVGKWRRCFLADRIDGLLDEARPTPTSASWINQVERWFAGLTRKPLQRGVHRSTGQFEADILTFIDRHNESPKPYRGTRSADEILVPVKRFRQKTDQTLWGEL